MLYEVEERSTEAVVMAKASGTPAIGKTRFDAVMNAAKSSALLGEKSASIGGRISPVLVQQATSALESKPIPI